MRSISLYEFAPCWRVKPTDPTAPLRPDGWAVPHIQCSSDWHANSRVKRSPLMRAGLEGSGIGLCLTIVLRLLPRSGAWRYGRTKV